MRRSLFAIEAQRSRGKEDKRRKLLGHHDRGLIVIGGLKLLYGVFFILVGIGALKLLHKDLVYILSGWAVDLRFNPENRFVNLVLDKVALIDAHRLKEISIAVFCYAALDWIEGLGLIYEKVWAEYLTIVLTASFLPWELFVLVRHATWAKFVLIVINSLVLLYLLFVVQKRLRHREQRLRSRG